MGVIVHWCKFQLCSVLAQGSSHGGGAAPVGGYVLRQCKFGVVVAAIGGSIKRLCSFLCWLICWDTVLSTGGGFPF
jgi:hypothetical protein